MTAYLRHPPTHLAYSDGIGLRRYAARMTDRLWKYQKNYRQYELQQAFHDLILVFMLSGKHSAGSEYILSS
jgi:hypothetical protein